MNYYRSNITGKIFTENSLKILDDVYGENHVEGLINSKIIRPIEDVSVVDCLNSGDWHVAVVRYRELHPEFGWDEACKKVGFIKKDMERLRKKEK